MTAQTMLADVIDALVDTWSADVTLTGLGVAVFDADEPLDQSAQAQLWVGGTGLEDDGTEAATVRREYAHASAQSDVDEVIDVLCAVWAWTGDTEMRPRRRTAQEIFDAAAAVLRTTQLGLAPRVMWCETPGFTLRQIQDDRGSAAVITFTARVRCRIEPS